MSPKNWRYSKSTCTSTICCKKVNGRKFTYNAKDILVMKANISHNIFEVNRYNKPKLAKQQYKNSKINFLPLALFPSAPFDIINQRYISRRYVSIINSLMHLINIELYNDNWL